MCEIEEISDTSYTSFLSQKREKKGKWLIKKISGKSYTSFFSQKKGEKGKWLPKVTCPRVTNLKQIVEGVSCIQFLDHMSKGWYLFVPAEQAIHIHI